MLLQSRALDIVCGLLAHKCLRWASWFVLRSFKAHGFWKLIKYGLLINVCTIFITGWQALFWSSLVPVIVRNLFLLENQSRLDWLLWVFNNFYQWQIILAVGTKLQGVMTKMALEITERHAVVQGIPLVQASDKYFWFGKPQLVLYLIHFALFSVIMSKILGIVYNFLWFMMINLLFYWA